MTNKLCIKCGYSWNSRIERPKSCPNCKSRNWDSTDSLLPGGTEICNAIDDIIKEATKIRNAALTMPMLDNVQNLIKNQLPIIKDILEELERYASYNFQEEK